MLIHKRIVAVSLMVSIALLVSACQPLKKADADKSEEDKEKELAVPVEVKQVTRGVIEASYRGSATLEAELDAEVVAEVAGVVEEILVEEGDRAAAGQVLARLDDEKLRLDVMRARAELDKQQNDFRRTQSMFNKKLISAENFERVKYELATQKAAYELVRLALKDSVLRAPFDGVVSARHIKTGNMVTVNQPAFHITQFESLHAILHVPEREINNLAVGQPASLTVDAWPDAAFSGLVKRINPVVDADTGTVKVTVEMSASDHKLKPGMFGRVSIRYDRHENALLIPKEAVISEDADSSVFVIKDSVAKRATVQTGYVNSHFIEVISGVDENDQIVTTGQTTLKDGVRVEVIGAMEKATPEDKTKTESKATGVS